MFYTKTFSPLRFASSMERWSGKIAVVTGASSGIGAATGVQLAKSGLTVVGLARRVERVEELKKTLPNTLKKSLYALKCDVSKEDEIIKTFAEIEKKFGGVDVLVNNAGVLRETTLIDKNNSVPIRETIDTNVLGLTFCTREAIQSMLKRKFDGHIIHINSIFGHGIPNVPGGSSFNVYPASKHAVTALTEALRQDLNNMKSKIRITSISPGFVTTEIINPKLSEALKASPFLKSIDIANAVVYVLSTPPRVQVHELTIKPVGELQ